MLPKKVPKKYSILVATMALAIILVFAVLTVTQIINGIVGLRQPLVAEECTDSDNGSITKVYGECLDSNRKINADTCVFTGLKKLQLREWHCSTFCEESIVNCTSDEVCSGGKCVPEL